MKKVNTRQPIEIAGGTHVIADLERVHKSWTPLGWRTAEVHRIDEDSYLASSRSPFTHARNYADVIWMNRLKAIERICRTGGSDDALRSMGVEIQTLMYEPIEMDINHPQTEILCISKFAPYIYNCLIKNADGRYIRSILAMRLDPDLDRQINRQVSQREAIAYALGRKRVRPEVIESLGIRPLGS